MTNNTPASESFVPVAKRDLEQLTKVLESRLPTSASIFNTALMLKSVTFEANLYTYQGDFSDNCWILCTTERNDYGKEIHISAPFTYVITDEIKTAFRTSEALDWNNRYIILAPDAWIAKMLLEISGVINRNATAFNPNYVYYMDKDDASQMDIELPNGFKTKDLNSKVGVDFLVKTWKYTLDGTRDYVQDVVSKSPSIGVFNGEEPVSGIMLNYNGLLGLLHTTHEYRGKGLAQLCMKSLAKCMADQGMIPTSCVEQKNTISKLFHEKIGMKISHEVYCIMYIASKW